MGKEDTLQRKLAEYHGAIFEHLGYDETGLALYLAWQVTYKGKQGNGWSYEEAMERAGVPAWTTNTDDALALCLSIARKHNWCLTISDIEDGDTFVRLYPPRTDNDVCSARGATPALALSLLAWRYYETLTVSRKALKEVIKGV